MKATLCQPDGIKGCSVCCGLFNLKDTGRENLAGFLAEGPRREKLCRTYEEYTEPADVRDSFSHICPYQGFLAAGRPGCLIHPLSYGTDGRDRSLFARAVCGKFLCPAHQLLSETEKENLIASISDWYLYSTAIIDPESYSFIHEYALKICGKLSAETYALIETGLKAHAENLSLYDGILFYYSVPEYNLNRERFSLRCRGDFRERVTSAMVKHHAGREGFSPA